VLAGVYISTMQNACSPHFISESFKLHRCNSARTIQANLSGIALAEYPSYGGVSQMDLTIWLPAMFTLGLGVMGLCYAFLIACENI
jgi:hypothetical protein